MAIIKELSSHLADLIAAGEVVERPASVAKELVENAIDAGSNRITVEIENGGITYLRIADNGCGMRRKMHLSHSAVTRLASLEVKRILLRSARLAFAVRLLQRSRPSHESICLRAGRKQSQAFICIWKPERYR